MTASAAGRFAALSSTQRVRLLRRLVETGRLDAIPEVVPPRDEAAPVRLSPSQQDLWVYEALYPDTAALNLCCAYHFDGPVDPADLETALTIVQDNHDVLRTRIRGDDLRVDFPPAGRFRWNGPTCAEARSRCGTSSTPLAGGPSTSAATRSSAAGTSPWTTSARRWCWPSTTW